MSDMNEEPKREMRVETCWQKTAWKAGRSEERVSSSPQRSCLPAELVTPPSAELPHLPDTRCPKCGEHERIQDLAYGRVGCLKCEQVWTPVSERSERSG